MSRFIISGTNSGCGKTTITCAILSALQQIGIKTAAFKCGPDYIDPMFHREVIGIKKTFNLDSYFCDDNTICYLLQKGSKDTDCTIIEGAMGYYDGGAGSTYQIANITDTSSIIVLNCRGMKESIGAIMNGFLHYKSKNHIAGFIFNQLPDSLIPFAEQLCKELNTEYIGYFPKHAFQLQSRHLGLIPANEIDQIKNIMMDLGKIAIQTIKLDFILHHLSQDIPNFRPLQITPFKNHPIIAIAKDEAFCFRYTENIELLEDLGCIVICFSPLHDPHLPSCHGLYLCGGYPELHASELADNISMRNDILTAIKSHIPLIAECGGFMYLHKSIETTDGSIYPMVGLIPAKIFPQITRQRFGYISMRSDYPNLICDANVEIKAHEFHYWDSSNPGDTFHAVKPDGRSWDCAHATETMYAGFPHLYFPSNPEIAYRFTRKCIEYGALNGTYQTDSTV